MNGLHVKFSGWKHWDERASLPGITNPGVYLLAYYKDKVPKVVRPNAEQIIYIGETCRNSLRGRLREFNRSAFENKGRHSGGHTYRKRFGNKKKHLHVAIYPVQKLSDELRPLFIRFVERKLIWEYAKKWGKAPICNQK